MPVNEKKPLPEKKLTNMVWKSVKESIFFSLLLVGATIYLLQMNGLITPFDSWLQVMEAGMLVIGAAVCCGAVFGFWQSNKLKRRIDLIQQAVHLWEKGNLSRAIPSLGEDEIGRLADQLGKISVKWEEQVTVLQRLSNSNAELAEKARNSAIIEERQRLARELHDAVSQQLFAISMTATALGRTIEKDLDKSLRQVSLIEEMSSVAQSEMRALLLHLRPVHLEGKGLSQGVLELLQELSSKAAMEIVWELDEGIRMAKGIEDHLFRIVQEALSNALRHSQATRLELKLQQRHDQVRLTIYDNGIGFNMTVQKQMSYGLVSMRERVNEIGGSINIVSAPGKGTRLEIRVPLLAEESKGGETSEHGKRD